MEVVMFCGFNFTVSSEAVACGAFMEVKVIIPSAKTPFVLVRSD